MSSRLAALVVDTPDPDLAAVFWAELLRREVWPTEDGLALPGTPTQVGLRFASGSEPPQRPGWIHLHVTSDTASGQPDQDAVVAQARELGATHLDVGQQPGEGHVVLADPTGREFCVIEPGNSYLAGCGPLGELACDGTHDVGLFWAAALDWPLVWDQGEETAVQSPAGGTKVAWGGPPLASRSGRRDLRYDLVLDEDADLRAETDRLIALGAQEIGAGGGQVELADPDGNEFTLRPA